MSFYRKYRPQVIEEIDNSAVRKELLRLLSKDRKALPHAYLLTGPKGTGKTTTARLLAKLFNCHLLQSSGPCGACEACVRITKGTSMDVLEIDAASNRGIDEVRDLRDRVSLSPAEGGYKIFIIDEVHMMTTEAFNALLKTLEEPPAHAVFILATTDSHKVPATIASRCMRIAFHKASNEELLHVLHRIVKDEQIAIDDDALLQLAHIADGSFRDAVKLLEQLSFHKEPITIAIVHKTLAVTEEHTIDLFLESLAQKDLQKLFAHIDGLVQEGKDIKTFTTDVLFQLEKILIQIALGKPVAHWDKNTVSQCISFLMKAYEEIRYSPIAQLPLELAVTVFCGEKPVQELQTMPVEEKQKEPEFVSQGLLTLEKLKDHWSDFIAATKPHNHSVAGVLRSSRPKAVTNGIVTIEAFYTFHQEKLSEIQSKAMLELTLKKLFGEKAKVEIVLGKK